MKHMPKAGLLQEIERLQRRIAELEAKGGAPDITERKRAEEALRESELKFRETVQYLDEGYYNCTADGRLQEHNRAFNRILGFDLGQDLKRSLLPDFWQNPDDRKEYLAELMSRGFIGNFLIKAKTIRGEKLIIMANSHLVRDEKGAPARIEGPFTDFTERKQAEEALRQNMEELRAANDELELFNLAATGRELRMIELKQEINELCRRLGEPPRHATDQLETDNIPGAGPASAPPGGGGA